MLTITRASNCADSERVISYPLLLQLLPLRRPPWPHFPLSGDHRPQLYLKHAAFCILCIKCMKCREKKLCAKSEITLAIISKTFMLMELRPITPFFAYFAPDFHHLLQSMNPLANARPQPSDRFCTVQCRGFVYFTMGRHCAPQNCHVIPWAHPNVQPKQHLERFGRFCKAHYCVTDSQRDGQTTLLGR